MLPISQGEWRICDHVSSTAPWCMHGMPVPVTMTGLPCFVDPGVPHTTLAKPNIVAPVVIKAINFHTSILLRYRRSRGV